MLINRYQIVEDESFPTYWLYDDTGGKLTHNSIALGVHEFTAFKKVEKEYNDWQKRLGLLYLNRIVQTD